MEQLGLVTAQTSDPVAVRKIAAEPGNEDERIKKRHWTTDSKESRLKQVFIDWSVMFQLLLGAATGIGAYQLMKNRDKNKAKIKYLNDKLVGSNQLAASPKLSIADLPVATSEILVTPGDPKQETLVDDPKKQQYAKNSAPVDVIDVKPIEDTGIFQEVKKKDALFA